MAKRDTYFCPICHATIDGRSQFENHKESHNAKTACVTVAELAPVIADPIQSCVSSESLSTMTKPELIEIARQMGIDKIEGKYLSQCKAGYIEAAIVAKKGE